MIMRSIFTQASVQLHFLCFCFHSVIPFSSFFVLAFFTIAIVKQPHYKRISLHLHPVLHPITLRYIRSAVVLLGLPAHAFSLFTILGQSRSQSPRVFWSAPRHGVLALTKRHVGSGKEIDSWLVDYRNI